MSEFYPFIGSLGFPIVMCVYLIHSFSSTLEKLSRTITHQNTLISTLNERLNNVKR